jgi:hypothetical protein
MLIALHLSRAAKKMKVVLVWRNRQIAQLSERQRFVANLPVLGLPPSAFPVRPTVCVNSRTVPYTVSVGFV